MEIRYKEDFLENKIVHFPNYFGNPFHMLYNKVKTQFRDRYFQQGGIYMKKIEGHMAELMKEIIHDGDSVIEIDGKKYYLSLIEKPETTVAEDVEADQELKQKLLQAKRDILNGKAFTTEEVIEMIDQGEL